jgi:hypothetical protein
VTPIRIGLSKSIAGAVPVRLVQERGERSLRSPRARRLGLVGPFVTHCLGHLGPRKSRSVKSLQAARRTSKHACPFESGRRD